MKYYDKFNDQEYAFQLYNEMSYCLFPIAGTANHVAMQSLFDCYDYFEENRMLNYNVKRYMNMAAKEYDKYLIRVRKIQGDKFPLFSDMSRIAAAKLQPQVNDLHDAITEFTEKHHLDNPELKAALCTTHALIGISCSIIETIRDHYQSKTAYNISADINTVRMAGVMHAFDMIARMFLKVGANVDIDSDEKVCAATSAIMKKYEERDFLNEASREALRLNPAMMKYVRDEDKNLFEDDTKKEEN